MQATCTHTDRYSAKYSLENLGCEKIDKNLNLFGNNLPKECNASQERARVQLIISIGAVCHTFHS